MIIGVTDTMVSQDKFNYYIKWLEGSGMRVGWVKLSYKLDNLNVVNSCDGLLLTGGNDIDPSLYGGPTNHSKIIDVDKERDNFERKLIDKVLMKKIPTLAICRGMQLLNVHLGGTLLPDIEDAGYKSHRAVDNVETRHPVAVVPGSLMYDVTGTDFGHVNSSHHQAVDKPGNGLKVSARAEDGIIEGMEFGSDNDMFCLLLQWHPERMPENTNGKNNPLSTVILKKFLTNISENLQH
jgi:putative glutamine amidotransferase